jgi:formylglycine-generating enzyme required for sulfatase activity
MSAQPKRYRAFISYSQRDKPYARRLHQALESYRVPTGVDAANVDAKTRKLGRFFRDDEEMGAATDLGAALEGAIADAESLIVVCSPHAAQSRWVNEEIIHFKRTDRAARIFAVIVGGEPNAPAAANGLECFPPALRFKLGADGALTQQPTEPLAVDLRKDPFNRIIARLVAGLVNTPFDALWKREQRRTRARMVLASVAFAIIAVIVGAALTQSLWRPNLEAYWRYGRFVHATAELAVARPGTTFQDCRQGSGDCPVMVVIPEGRFIMGSPLEDPDNFNGLADGGESPQHEVSIARFAVSQTEITFGDWQRCFDAGACGNEMPDRRDWYANDSIVWNETDRPVINVSWDDVQKYVAWLSRVTGRTYRLLSEAEWEYAARANTNIEAPHTRFSWGDEDPVCEPRAPNGVSFSACEQFATLQVAIFPANAFGLYDLHGNVAEWIEDCRHSDYTGAPSNGEAWGESDCAARGIRGGGWDYNPVGLRSAYRDWRNTSARSTNVGLRVARTL